MHDCDVCRAMQLFYATRPQEVQQVRQTEGRKDPQKRLAEKCPTFHPVVLSSQFGLTECKLSFPCMA